MLKEIFIGRNPSHFQMDPIVKAFIVSEAFFWSAYNFILPIFGIFASFNITGGNVGIAASAYSVFLVARIIFELISGRYLEKVKENKKYLAALTGILIVSSGYLGFAFTSNIFNLYLFYGLIGIGFGICTPAKLSLFSKHLDKNKEVMEWGLYDAIALLGMALAASLGGFIAKEYGFKTLFLISSAVNLLGSIPYFLFIKKTPAAN